MKKVLLMFSGGKDTMLSACLLAESNYDVLLITYDNGAEKGLEISFENFLQLKRIYKNIHHLGIKDISRTWKQFLRPFLLGKLKTNLLPMEYFCITCRLSMYVHSTALAVSRRINYIAEGARRSQLFPEQHPSVLKRFRELAEYFDLEVLLPVYDMKSEEVKEELLMRNITPRIMEPYCIFSMPLYTYRISEGSLEELTRLLDEILMPKAKYLIGELIEKK